MAQFHNTSWQPLFLTPSPLYLWTFTPNVLLNSCNYIQRITATHYFILYQTWGNPLFFVASRVSIQYLKLCFVFLLHSKQQISALCFKEFCEEKISRKWDETAPRWSDLTRQTSKIATCGQRAIVILSFHDVVSCSPKHNEFLVWIVWFYLNKKLKMPV